MKDFNCSSRRAIAVLALSAASSLSVTAAAPSNTTKGSSAAKGMSSEKGSSILALTTAAPASASVILSSSTMVVATTTDAGLNLTGLIGLGTCALTCLQKIPDLLGSALTSDQLTSICTDSAQIQTLKTCQTSCSGASNAIQTVLTACQTIGGVGLGSSSNSGTGNKPAALKPAPTPSSSVPQRNSLYGLLTAAMTGLFFATIL